MRTKKARKKARGKGENLGALVQEGYKPNAVCKVIEHPSAKARLDLYQVPRQLPKKGVALLDYGVVQPVRYISTFRIMKSETFKLATGLAKIFF